MGLLVGAYQRWPQYRAGRVRHSGGGKMYFVGASAGINISEKLISCVEKVRSRPRCLHLFTDAQNVFIKME